MKVKTIYCLLLMAVFIFAVSCSSSRNDPISNIPAGGKTSSDAGSSHHTWGTWQFIADPVNETLDVVQLRGVEMHVNVLPFLEPPALSFLTLESLEFNGNII